MQRAVNRGYGARRYAYGNSTDKVEEKTFTEDTYKEIQETNNKASATDGFNFSVLKDPKSISGTLKLEAKDGFSLLSEDDLKALSESNATDTVGGSEETTNTESGATEEETTVKANKYEYITIAVTCPATSDDTAQQATVTTTGNDEKGSENDSSSILAALSVTVTYKLKAENAEEKKIDDISAFMGENSDSDPLISDVQVLMSKAMGNGTEGEGENSSGGGGTTPSLSLNFKDYLAQIIAIGNATPTMSLSVTITPTEGDAHTVAIDKATIGGDVEENKLTFGGAISAKKGESVLASLKGDVSLVFSEDFDIHVHPGEDDEITADAPKGSIDFAVENIEFVYGSIKITGNIAGSIDSERLYILCDFKEQIDGKDYIATTFTIDSDIAKDGFLDALTFTKFELNGEAYSGKSVKAVLKKMSESKKSSI